MIHPANSARPAHKAGQLRRLGLAALVALSMVATSLAPLSSVHHVSAQDSGGGTAAYAPETALLYANVELDQDSGQWEQAAELTERAGITDLVPADSLAELEDGLAQIDGIFDGEAALVLATLPDTGNFGLGAVGSEASAIATDPEAVSEGDVPEGWSIVFQPSDPEALYDTLRENVLGSDGREASSGADSVDYEGYTIDFVEPADEFGTGSAIALVDDVVVISTRPDDIEPIIDTATGTVAPLSELSEYADLRERAEDEVLSFGFINGPAILTGVEEQDPAALADVPEELLASFNAYSSFAFWADEPGFRLDTLAVPAEGQSLPEATTLEPAFPDAIDGDSLLYAAGSDLGQQPSVNALALLFAQELVGIDAGATPVAAQDPEAYADEVFAEAEATLGFNIKEDFLDNMVGEWGIAVTAADVLSSEPVINGIFASNVDDTTAVEDVVGKITAIAESGAGNDFDVASREVNGSSITTIDVSDAGFPLVIEFGVVDDQFLIGVNEGIDTFVDGPDSSLADNDTFQATLDALPAEFSSISFLNLELIAPIVEEAVIGVTSSNLSDADPACGEFDTQEEAQDAYDKDNFENFALDQDFDGTACEDFFTEDTATPEATPGIAESINVRSIGTVTFQDDGASGTSTIILIGE